MDVFLQNLLTSVRSKATLTDWLHKDVQAEKSEGKLAYTICTRTVVDTGSGIVVLSQCVDGPRNKVNWLQIFLPLKRFHLLLII